MGELRQDRISGQWVVMAPHRADRPTKATSVHGHASSPKWDQNCPFCPGNEHALPWIVAEFAAGDASGWNARVVPNKYAAFASEIAPTAPAPSLGAMPAFGAQEVIIENPRHNVDIADLNQSELWTVMQCYRHRFTALIESESIRAVTLFRNHGPTSGASMEHPHSQLVATALLPPKRQFLQHRAQDYFERHATCIVCKELEQELASSLRIVEKTGSFLTIVPFAAQYPFEIWVVPMRHQARFDEIKDGELRELGSTLRRSLRRLKHLHGEISYNFVIDSASRDGGGAGYLHWLLRIKPDLVHWGGFELGTDIPINPSNPEQDARMLRTTDLPD